ncbi:MAG: hypothetical protein ACRD0G_03370, partial [Acidimicrobiales bacterium]
NRGVWEAIGLAGSNVDTDLDDAVEAWIAGDVAGAGDAAASVVGQLDGAAAEGRRRGLGAVAAGSLWLVLAAGLRVRPRLSARA